MANQDTDRSVVTPNTTPDGSGRNPREYVAGAMAGGVESPRREGTPQGGPLSPLLSNILLDDLDKELERRSHAFCRPWQRKFLGYSMTIRKQPRLKVAPVSVQRLKSKLRTILRRGPWWNSGASHMNQALPDIEDRKRPLNRG